jgi:hypothetical protein
MRDLRRPFLIAPDQVEADDVAQRGRVKNRGLYADMG